VITVKRQKIGDTVYRLANLSYAQGYAVQVLDKSGKRYRTIDYLGWVHEDDAREHFNKFCEHAKKGVVLLSGEGGSIL